MSAIIFDTHRIVRRPKEIGFFDLQAGATTDLPEESRGQAVETSGLATKADLAGFATKADLAAAKAELQVALAGTRTDILKWVTGAIGLQTIVVVGAVAPPARAL